MQGDPAAADADAGAAARRHLCPALLAAPSPPIPSGLAAARQVFSIVTGFLLIYYPFGDGCLHAFATSMLVYACMRFNRRRCGTLAWLVTFPYLVTL